MPVTKPNALPLWATGGMAQIVVPSPAKILLGWIIEKPPFQFFNYLFNLIGQWIAWHDQGYSNVQFVNLAVCVAGVFTLPLGSVEVYVDATAGPIKIQLPDVTDNDGMRVKVTKIDVSANVVTVSAIAGKAIDDNQNQTTAQQFTSLDMTSFGGNLYL